MRLTRQSDPMLIPYMGGEIILSFNPLVSDLVAPGNRAIHSLVEMLHFVVTV